VLILAGFGTAIHLPWIVATTFFRVWIVGLALGRGQSAGRHDLCRW
jgi:hypothetical protein